MRQAFLLIIMLIITPGEIFGQLFTDVRLGAHVGYNSYSLHQFKSFENNATTSIGSLVPMKTMQNYPNRGSLGISVNYVMWDIENSIKYTFHSSGSRRHYADYSGHVGLDAVMKSHAITGESSFKVFENQTGSRIVFVGVAVTNYYGSYRVSEYMEVPQFKYRDSYNFKFDTFTIEPVLKRHHIFGDHIATIKIGFDLMISSQVTYENQPVSFNSGGGSGAKADMGGLRLEFGYQYRLKPRKRSADNR